MGASLAKEALVRFPDIGYDALRVLMSMALHALDQPSEDGTPPRLYFGGADALLLVLRPHLPDDRRKRAAAKRDLARVMEDLVAAGAVSRVGGKARAENRQTWRLVLKPTGNDLPSRLRYQKQKARRALAKRRSEDGMTTHPEDGMTTHPEDGMTSPSRMGGHPTPRSHEEPLEDLKEEPADDRFRSNGLGSGYPQAAPNDGNWPGHFADADDGTVDGNWPGHLAGSPDPPRRLRSVK